MNAKRRSRPPASAARLSTTHDTGSLSASTRPTQAPTTGVGHLDQETQNGPGRHRRTEAADRETADGSKAAEEPDAGEEPDATTEEPEAAEEKSVLEEREK